MADKSIGDEKTIGGDRPKGFTLAAGQTLGQYRIVRPLARGGMGEVYEVEHQVLRRRYALKLLPADFAGQSGALARFEREAQVMANLEHPNIIRVDDFGETGGRYWLRMELAGGVGKNSEFRIQDSEGNSQKSIVSLQDLADARGGRIPQEELVGILKQILEGLAYAHKHGAIHRDLKPSNILFSGGTAKIADFGLVRLVGEEWVRSQAQVSVQRSMSIGDARTMQRDPDEGTSTRSMLGTYEYMSPEQKRGEEATAQSDIYAVGLMAYRLLTGRGLSMKTPSQILRWLVPDWDGLVARALEEEPGERWPNAAAMAGVLGGIAREIHQADAERPAVVQQAQASRRVREEAEGKARAEAEVRRSFAVFAARQKEERERRAAEAARIADQARNRSAGKTNPGGKVWIWVLAALVFGIGAYLFWHSQSRNSRARVVPVSTFPTPSPSAAVPDAMTVRKKPTVKTPAAPISRERSANLAAVKTPLVPGRNARIEDLGLELVWGGPRKI